MSLPGHSYLSFQSSPAIFIHLAMVPIRFLVNRLAVLSILQTFKRLQYSVSNIYIHIIKYSSLQQKRVDESLHTLCRIISISEGF